MSGSKNDSTFTEWTTMLQKEIRSSYPSRQHQSKNFKWRCDKRQLKQHTSTIHGERLITHTKLFRIYKQHLYSYEQIKNGKEEVKL